MEELARKIAMGILLVPFALLGIWLDLPWWAFDLCIGLIIFVCLAAWHEASLALKQSALSFAASAVLGVAALMVANHLGISLAELTEDRSVLKQVRRLPDYALAAFAFSVAATIAAAVRSHTSAPVEQPGEGV